MTPNPHPADALRANPLLTDLPPDDAQALARYFEVLEVEGGEAIVREGEPGVEMFFVLAGRARVFHAGLEVQVLEPGDHFGELALLAARPRAASVIADERLTLARLSRKAWDRMAVELPAVALALLRRVVDRLGMQLVHMTENVGTLLRERSLPRRTSLDVKLFGAVRPVSMGTLLGAVLPTRHEGALVTAGLVDRKPFSLGTPLFADCTLEPLTTSSWEGREVYRRSAGLVLLEAAARVGVVVRNGPSLSSAQVIEVSADADHFALAELLELEVRRIADADLPIVEELWAVEEASSHFQTREWSDAQAMLRTWRDPTVRLVTCGQVYALALAPLLPRTGALRDLTVRPYAGNLLLDFGSDLTENLPEGAREVSDPTLSVRRPETPRSSEMVVEHKAWLRTLGVDSVGAFNLRCIRGDVSELIRAAEGFHEKRIGRAADLIKERTPRVITIAGPSSSGKTTFIKRLTVQLQINGMIPRAISLDDYYVDREKTPLDAAGALDFEALEALDLALLQDHLARLLAGQRVRTAHYDFVTGKSHPDGGPELQLADNEVLMLEGIHGLNPALLGEAVPREAVFRTFIHPVVGLPIDRLTMVSPADIRLLRRIVRDRHSRNLSAAQNIQRWPAVRDGERKHIFPFLPQADSVFDSSLAYEPSVLKVFADRYLLEVPREHPSYTTAYRLRKLIDHFVTIYPDHVPPTSLLREFIGGSGFEY